MNTNENLIGNSFRNSLEYCSILFHNFYLTLDSTLQINRKSNEKQINYTSINDAIIRFSSK